MSRLIAIWKKELRSYFNSPIAYIFFLVFLMYTAAQFFMWTSRGRGGEFRGNFFVIGEATLTNYFAVFPLILGVLVPALCMRLWPEEYKSGTIETLMTLPIRTWEVVVGKFFAMTSILVVAFILSLVVPYSVSIVAAQPLDMGPIIGGYIAALFMGAAYCSVGMLASAFAREQVVALLLALAICLFFALAGTPDIDLMTPTWFSPIGKFLGFSVRFQSIAKGVVDLRDLVYFTSFIALFVSLNISVIETRRLR